MRNLLGWGWLTEIDIFSGGGVLLRLFADLPHLLQDLSPDGRAIAGLLINYGILAFLVLAIIVGLLMSFSRKYAAKPGDDATYREAQDEGGLETKFAVAVTLLVIALGVYGLRVTWRIDTPPGLPDPKPDLRIIGHQWWWEIQYPASGVVTANVAHIPTGKRLLVALESADVVHDWWVAGLGRKMDAIPGRTNYFWLEADQPGTHEGACNEFCGLQHAWMRIRVVAETPEDFEKWQTQQGQTALQPTTEMAIKGAALFQEMSCATCHTIRGTAANVAIGPDLTHLASRPTMLSGKVEYSKENLRRWLNDPQAEKPGAHMPRFIFDAGQLEALTEYLDGLK
jgi:cytochrome c oxidase subunit 2